MPARHFRSHQRFSTRLPVTVVAAERQVRAEGATLDLGIGEASFELDTPLRLSEVVTCKLGGPSPAVLVGEVAWVGWAESSAVRLGVRFRSADAEQIAQILDALGVAAEVGA